MQVGEGLHVRTRRVPGRLTEGEGWDGAQLRGLERGAAGSRVRRGWPAGRPGVSPSSLVRRGWEWCRRSHGNLPHRRKPAL